MKEEGASSVSENEEMSIVNTENPRPNRVRCASVYNPVRNLRSLLQLLAGVVVYFAIWKMMTFAYAGHLVCRTNEM